MTVYEVWMVGEKSYRYTQFLGGFLHWYKNMKLIFSNKIKAKRCIKDWERLGKYTGVSLFIMEKINGKYSGEI
jgi:hypothetical protein